MNEPKNHPPAFAIGSPVWPGLSKLTEEAGETLQIVGKLMGTGGDSRHWDGKGDLRERLVLELADLSAAIEFVVKANGLDDAVFLRRVRDKFYQFAEWHQRDRVPLPPRNG